MPRPDYNRLIKLFQNQKHYKLVAPGQPESRYHHIKIYDARTVKIENGVNYHDDYLGVDIDIFAIDGCPDNQEEYEKIRRRIHKLYRRHCILKCGYNGTVKHRILFMLYRLFTLNTNYVIKKAIKLCEKHDFDHSKYAARYGRYGLGFRVPIENYSSAVAKKFEDHAFKVPIGYDAVLKAQFGDYMQLPPPEERVTHHGNKVYWKEGPEQ